MQGSEIQCLQCAARCTAENEDFGGEHKVHKAFVILCGKELAYFVAASTVILIGNGIHYAQKSHLEVQEGMNPSERRPARRPQPLGRPAPRAARVQRAPGQTVHAIPLPQSRTVPKRNLTRISLTSSDTYILG